jgi:hypothetical protein
MEGKRRQEIKTIVEAFRGQLVTNDLLKAYCERHGYERLTEGEYQDWLFQYEHDERVAKALPAIFAELTKFQYTSEFAGDEERRRIREENEAIEIRIAELMEEHGVRYGKEVDVFTGNLGGALQGLMQNAGVRASNMGANTLLKIAIDTLGQPLTLKKLVEYKQK